ncbi:HIT family protein [Clostridium sardiniense]|uniref:HIT family protein n=1 Tax=Clostridium sardiniense TaxID=29369 RepID=UPI003D32A527
MKISSCLGCKLSHKQLPVYVVYEDDYVICILDHSPFNKGHTLILTKHHFFDLNEFDVETSNAIMNASILISKAIKLAYNPDGITICQNGGIFNDLTHYHMHVIPRYKDQCFANFYLDDEINIKDKKTNLKEVMIDIIDILKTI